jgi:hypothetical protein
MVASLLAFPFAAVWWTIAALVLARRPLTAAELRRRLTAALAAAWASLTLLLPALFAWVWADRVAWLVF